MTTNSSTNPKVPETLIAFPTVRSALCFLPKATSLQQVNLQPKAYGQDYDLGTEKLAKALSKNTSQNQPPAQYLSPTGQYLPMPPQPADPAPQYYPTSPKSHADTSEYLMMRTPKPKFSI